MEPNFDFLGILCSTRIRAVAPIRVLDLTSNISTEGTSNARNLAVYKRPIGATVYFDGFTKKLQERHFFSQVRRNLGKEGKEPFA